MSPMFEADLKRFGPEAQYRRPSLYQARRYCRSFALCQYENFVVGSLLLPRRLQPHFYVIYAYCRWADNLADETGHPNDARQRLRWWRTSFLSMLHGEAHHPVMVALRATMDQFAIPPEPFLDLLVAFEQDQTVREYETFTGLLEYCRCSANPVGRILLYLFGVHSVDAQLLSDQICTGLQLANFWQDVARDAALGRCYLPREDRLRFHYTDAEWTQKQATPAFRSLLQFEVERARSYLQAGQALQKHLPAEVAPEITLIVQGGHSILDAIAKQNYDIWSARPKVSRWRQAQLLARQWFMQHWNNLQQGARVAFKAQPPCQRRTSAPYHKTTLKQSFRYCEALARVRAGNFYYTFWMLPTEQRRGMCALYAFMRITDDLADEPGPPLTKQLALARWQQGLDEAFLGTFSHRLHPALIYTVQRFRINPQWLHEVIQGVTNDLTHRRFMNQEELFHYCDQVAGVVGLACLAIWGCHDQSVTPFALAAGRAFQITNILRDVYSDARDNRCYIPQDVLSELQTSDKEVWQEPSAVQTRKVMEHLARLAHGFYRQAKPVDDFLPQEGKVVWQLMSQTYFELLQRIEQQQFQTNRTRIRLPLWRKMQLFASAIPKRWGLWFQRHST